MQLEALLHGESDAATSEHVAGCAACGEQLETMRANEALLDRIRRTDGVGGGGATATGAAGQFEGYEVAGEVHRGAQGVVYEATQLTTRRTVALKVLGAGAFATTRQRRRFDREVDLIADLRHPNIVTVYDSGVTRDDRHWFAMEFIRGRTLDEHVAGDATRPTLAALLKLFTQICDALNYAHQRGVIHRDLKPGNIMVDDAGTPHVVDFGLARPVDPEVCGEQATVTVAGSFLGTVAYASPEQTRGDQTLIDVRSDVYALGVVLYELLAGRYPYPVEGTLSDVLDAIATKPPRPLRGLVDNRYAVDDELETIALKALAKEPERRYQSAAALRRDIDHYLAGEAIDAKRDSAWYVIGKTMSRHKVPVAVAAAFVLVLAVATVSLAVLNRRLADEKEKLAAVNIFLEDTLGSVEGAAGQRDVTVFELLAEGEAWIEMVLADEPETEAAVRAIIGNGFRNIDRLDHAEAQLQTALERRRETLGDDHPEVARSMVSLALLRRDQERLDEAERLLRNALAVRIDHAGPNDLAVAYTLSNLSSVRRGLGDLDEAEALMRRSLAIRREARGDDHPDVAMAMFRLGELLELRDDRAGAIAQHRAALRIRRAKLDARHPDIPRSLLALATLLMADDDAAGALPLLEEAIEQRSKLRGVDHWRVAEARSVLGACLLQLDRRIEATPHLESSCATLRDVLGADDAITRRACAWLDRAGVASPD